MKSFALFCFLLLASACVFVARAEEETPAVDDAPKLEDQPEIVDAASDEEQADEEDTEDDEENEDNETEGDEEETTDVADDEPEKRGWICRVYRKGSQQCRVCGCRRVCRRVCHRRVCKRVRCGTRRVCRTVYKIIRYKSYIRRYRGYGPRFVWKTKRVPRRVCRNLPKFCTRCSNIPHPCKTICGIKCGYRKCLAYRG